MSGETEPTNGRNCLRPVYKDLYISRMAKDVEFVDNALDDLRSFPGDARREAGFQIDKVQHGLDPDDWKPMNTVGPGAREIRIREASGAFRVIYVAMFKDAVYVLHCFRKTSEQTEQRDIDLAARRYRKAKEMAR